jgi:hypothetical protein
MARHAHRAKVLNVHGQRITSLGYSEALALVEADQANRLSRPKAPLVIQMKPRELEFRSQASISVSDMRANAGEHGVRLRGRRPGRIGNHVDRAMSKIEAWPEIGDSKAVRVWYRR